MSLFQFQTQMRIIYVFFIQIIPTILGAYNVLIMPEGAPKLEIDVNDDAPININVMKAIQGISGGHDTCFIATLNIQGTPFLVQIDTGSSDTAIPHSTLNNYAGPNISYSIPAGQSTNLYDIYGDTSFWKGYSARLPTSFGSTSINATAPISLMTVQSTSPLFLSSNSQGLMGVAYPPLSAIAVTPVTVMDAWYNSGSMARNRIAIYGCPFLFKNQSWIDFGDETPYTGCPGSINTLSIATIQMPTKSYFTLNVTQILISSIAQPLPSTFQQKSTSYYGGSAWSILDSCTSNILLPAANLAAFIAQITSSGGLVSSLQNSQYLTPWLNGQISLGLSDAYFRYSLLPTLSFTISAGSNQLNPFITLTIGPKQYFQQNSAGYWIFMMGTSPDTMAILGLPFFSSYQIVIDKTNGLITFQRGCGCSTASDIYPTITAASSNTGNSSLSLSLSPSATATVTTTTLASTTTAVPLPTNTKSTSSGNAIYCNNWMLALVFALLYTYL